MRDNECPMDVTIGFGTVFAGEYDFVMECGTLVLI
jgi:hypothetical protein